MSVTLRLYTHTSIYIYIGGVVIIIVVGNGQEKNELKFWMRLFAFTIVLIPMGKLWMRLFSLQLWITDRADWAL